MLENFLKKFNNYSNYHIDSIINIAYNYINKIIIGNFELDLASIGTVGKIAEMENYDVNIGDNISFKGEKLDQGNVEISGESNYNQERRPDRFIQQMNGTTGYKNITFDASGAICKSGTKIEENPDTIKQYIENQG